MGEPPALALFDLEHHGHHPHYLRHLATAWLDQRIASPLAIVVTPAFARAHADVMALERAAAPGAVRVTLLNEAEGQALAAATATPAVALQDFARGQLPADSRARIYWELFTRYAATLQPAQALLMHLDVCLLPLGMGSPAPVPFSGILFRPRFHYPATADAPEARAAALHGVHERFLLARALRHPMLRTVFCLDPTVVQPLVAENRVAAVPLADPLPYAAPGADPGRATAARRALGVEPGRRVLLLFGEIGQRKGWRPLLAALHAMPEPLLRGACLLVAGHMAEGEQRPFFVALEELRERTPMQVLTRLGYLADDLVPVCFDAADVVLAPYQRHAGMSGVLLLAAAHGKPVLSQDYGLMGQLTREHGLGLTVDTMDVTELARALRACLEQPPEALGDARGKHALAERHAPERFAETLLERLL